MGIINYLKETKGELKHVSWPTRKQVIAYSALVVLISIFVAAYLGGLDIVFKDLVSKTL